MGAYDPSIRSRGEAIDFMYNYRSNPPPLPMGWYLGQYIDRCISDSMPDPFVEIIYKSVALLVLAKHRLYYLTAILSRNQCNNLIIIMG